MWTIKKGIVKPRIVFAHQTSNHFNTSFHLYMQLSFNVFVFAAYHNKTMFFSQLNSGADYRAISLGTWNFLLKFYSQKKQSNCSEVKNFCEILCNNLDVMSFFYFDWLYTQFL